MNPNYQPARDEEAEWSVLSSLFAEPALLDRARAEVTDPDNFFQPLGKSVAKALGRGVPPDPVAMGEWVQYRDWETDRKSTRLNSSHSAKSRMPSSA